MNVSKNIGKNIRRIRKSKDLTMKELGNKIGISEQGIGNYERGDRDTSTEILIKIAEALNVDVSDLMKPNKTGIQELLEDSLEYGKAKNIKELSDKTGIPLEKINLFMNGGEYTPDDYNKVISITYGSYNNYIDQCPRKIVEKLAKERTKHDKALNSLYEALQYYYDIDIVKNTQDEIYIDLYINDKNIFYTKEEFENFLEYVALSLSTFKFINKKIKDNK